MKILIPYNIPFKLHTNSKGKVIPGGGEKFAFDIFDNFDSAIPLEITNEVKEKRQTKRVIQDAITKHNPDMILLNNPVGVGDHPNVMETIQAQIDIISQNKDRLNVLQEEFRGED